MVLFISGMLLGAFIAIFAVGLLTITDEEKESIKMAGKADLPNTKKPLD